MSLSVAGVWQVGVWDQTVWADDVWREGAYTAATVRRTYGGLPILVRPIKRHKKLETFREELEALIFGIKAATPEETGETRAIEKAADQVDLVTERFNIVQTFDDKAVIASQMELLWQDYSSLFNQVRGIIGLENRSRNEEEAIILALYEQEQQDIMPVLSLGMALLGKK